MKIIIVILSFVSLSIALEMKEGIGEKIVTSYSSFNANAEINLRNEKHNKGNEDQQSNGVKANLDAKNLTEHINDFINLIPFSEVFEITSDYVSNSEEGKKTSNFFRSEETKELVKELERLPQFKRAFRVLKSYGYNAYSFLQTINWSLFGLSKKPTPKSRADPLDLDFLSFCDTLLDTYPVEEARALYKQKLATIPEFVTLVKKLEAREFKVLFYDIGPTPTFQKLVNRAKEFDIDIVALLNKLEDYKKRIIL